MIGFDDRKPSTQMLMTDLHSVNNGLMNLVKDESFFPSKRDLYLLRQMNKLYHQGFAITYYVERRLTQRIKERGDESESFAKDLADMPYFEAPEAGEEDL